MDEEVRSGMLCQGFGAAFSHIEIEGHMNHFSKAKKGMLIFMFPAVCSFMQAEAEARMSAGLQSSGGGLLDLILPGAVLFGAYWFFRKRMEVQEEALPATPMAYGGLRQYDTFNDSPPSVEIGKNKLDVAGKISDSFNEEQFEDAVLESFHQIQGAWALRDLSGVRNLLTEEIYDAMQQDVEELQAQKRINKLDNIAVNSLEIVEARQKDDQTFITARFHADLLSYAVDESTGQVVAGAKDKSVKITEYWTFTRAEGQDSWLLSAINSGNRLIRLR